jgi:hypothetical protein
VGTTRDDFAEDVMRTFAASADNTSCNSECRALASGPQNDLTKALLIDLAANITSAIESGPRYNLLLSSEERRHPDNGIWLCQNCAKLNDSVCSRFAEKLIRAWKKIAEARAR